MAIWLWKVLDNRVVEACLGPALALGGLTIAFILLPAGSGLEGAAGFYGFFAAGFLIWEFIAALFRRR
jgi:hypothetical protein